MLETKRVQFFDSQCIYTCIAAETNAKIDRTLCGWFTGNDNWDYDSKTHHLDDVQSFFDTGDEDADDDVTDADDATAVNCGSAISLILTSITLTTDY